MRNRRSSYVDAAAWSALIAGALLWCPQCRAACPGHPVTADVARNKLADRAGALTLRTVGLG